MINLLLTSLEFKSLINSVVISVSVSFLATLLGLFLALIFYFYQLPGKKILAWFFLIPLLIPPYLHAFAWMHLLMFLGDFKVFGLTPSLGMDLVSSIPGVIGILTLSYFPIAFFMLRNSLGGISGQLIGAAYQVTSPGRVIIRIIVPSLIPAILTVTLLIFIFAFITFDVPAFLGINTFIIQIFKLFTFSGEAGRAVYLSIVPLSIVGILGFVLFKFFLNKKPFFSLTNSQVDDNLFISRSKLVTKIFSLITFLFFAVSWIIPLAVLQIKNIFYEKNPYSTGFSTEVIMNTLGISLISSICIILFSAVIFYLIKNNFWGRIILLMFFAFPPITFGIVFIHLFNQTSLNFIYSTPLILVVAYSLKFVPLAYELIYAKQQSINPQLINAARIINRSDWIKLTTIILPLYLPILFLAWTLSFWLVATELPITLLLQPAGLQTIITRLFIVLHYGAIELMSQMTASLILLCLVPIAGLYLFLNLEKYGKK